MVLTESNSVCSGLSVNPKWDPGQHNQQGTRDDDVDKEIPGVSPETKAYQQAGMYRCKRERLVNNQWHIATGEGGPKSTSRNVQLQRVEVSQ